MTWIKAAQLAKPTMRLLRRRRSLQEPARSRRLPRATALVVGSTEPRWQGMPSIVTLTMNPALDIATTTERIVADREIALRRAALRPWRRRHQCRPGGPHARRRCTCGLPGRRHVGRDALPVAQAERVPHSVVPITGITRESLAVVERADRETVSVPAARTLYRRARISSAVSTLSPAMPRGRSFLVPSGSMPPGSRRLLYTRRQAWRGTTSLVSCSIPQGLALAAASNGIF